jgi:hypothetical protein
MIQFKDFALLGCARLWTTLSMDTMLLERKVENKNCPHTISKGELGLIV